MRVTRSSALSKVRELTSAAFDRRWLRTQRSSTDEGQGRIVGVECYIARPDPFQFLSVLKFAFAGLCFVVCCLSKTIQSSEAEQSRGSFSDGLPPDIRALVFSTGCDPLKEFFDRDGIFGPPYILTEQVGGVSSALHVWCKARTSAADRPYTLLSISLEDGKSFQCPKELRWWNPPGGLSVSRRPRLNLSSYRSVDKPDRKSLSVKLRDVTVLVSSYDGATETFVCYKKAWYVGLTH